MTIDPVEPTGEGYRLAAVPRVDLERERRLDGDRRRRVPELALEEPRERRTASRLVERRARRVPEERGLPGPVERSGEVVEAGSRKPGRGRLPLGGDEVLERLVDRRPEREVAALLDDGNPVDLLERVAERALAERVELRVAERAWERGELQERAPGRRVPSRGPAASSDRRRCGAARRRPLPRRRRSRRARRRSPGAASASPGASDSSAPMSSTARRRRAKRRSKAAGTGMILMSRSWVAAVAAIRSVPGSGADRSTNRTGAGPSGGGGSSATGARAP